MTSNITSFIAPELPTQIPVAFSPTDELLMMIGATLGGAAPAPTYHVIIGLDPGHHVLVGSGGDKVD
jgi:hypothetical protein